MTETETSERFPNLVGDLYGYEELVPDRDRDLVLGVRDFMQREVRPIANDCWASSEFPHQLVPKLAQLSIVGASYGLAGRPATSRLVTGFISLEMSRVDTSIATFFGVHSGLALGSIVACASQEQKDRWLPDMVAMR